MNSKEALARLTYCVNDMESEEKYYKTVKQDLDRLEKLEKENQELKEKCKMLEENEESVLATLEISVQENAKLKKVINILVDKKVNILVLKYFIEKGEGVKTYNSYYTTKEKLTTEEYELLKERLGDVK